MDTQMLKILHLVDARGIYGAEVMLLNLIEQQLKNNIMPVLGSIGRKGEGERPIEEAARAIGLPVIRFTASKGIDLLAGFNIIKWAKKNKIHTIHTHGYKPNLLIAFFPRKWRKISIVRTLHGWTNITKWSKGGLYQRLDVFSLKFTEVLIAVSSAMLQKRPLLNSSLQIEIIENGIKKPEFSSQMHDEIKADKIYRFCTGSHMLLSIGRLSEEKGFDNLILAIAHMLNDGVDIKLCIIGEGPQRQRLEALIKEGNLQNRVLLPGYRKNAFRFIPLFSTYILSSHTEGLPITILEAMHLETPIVATKVGGVEEALDGGAAGSLLDNNDAMNISSHLKKFIKDFEKRKTIVEKAKIRALTIYSAATMEQKYKSVYLHHASVLSEVTQNYLTS